VRDIDPTFYAEWQKRYHLARSDLTSYTHAHTHTHMFHVKWRRRWLISKSSFSRQCVGRILDTCSQLTWKSHSPHTLGGTFWPTITRAQTLYLHESCQNKPNSEVYKMATSLFDICIASSSVVFMIHVASWHETCTHTHTHTWTALHRRDRRIACHRLVRWWAYSPILEVQILEQLSHGQTPTWLPGCTPYLQVLQRGFLPTF